MNSLGVPTSDLKDQINRIIVDAKKIGVIQILGGDCDENILDLRDQATNCLLGRRHTEKFYPLGCLQPSKSLRCKAYVCTAENEKPC